MSLDQNTTDYYRHRVSLSPETAQIAFCPKGWYSIGSAGVTVAHENNATVHVMVMCCPFN